MNVIVAIIQFSGRQAGHPPVRRDAADAPVITDDSLARFRGEPRSGARAFFDFNLTRGAKVATQAHSLEGAGSIPAPAPHLNHREAA